MPFSKFNNSVPKPLGNKYIKNPQSIGDKIRNRRLELRLLQKEVADILGTEENAIYRWETNRNDPDMRYMPAIIKFLGYLPIEINASTVGGKLKAYRYSKGLSQEQMGILLGINESTVFHYEKGQHKPQPSILLKLKTLAIIP